ncbi:MAG: protein kinase [bacterium]|nr:protein kinase [bacterium]
MIVKEPDLTGKELSNYKIISRLGKGGMATVYKAHELSLNRMVALKVLSHRLSEDTQFIKRFQREAQAAAKLNHPHIMQVYAIGEEDGIHYFAMEYIKGETLSDIVKEHKTMTPDRSVPLMMQVAEGLHVAHEAGLIHRDIKPSNIMLDPAGKAKVTDFGIAYVMSAETKLTTEGSIIGTPEYLSPEQCNGKPVDARSDIYSLGVTFYEILTGKTPYEADTPVSMLMKIVKGTFPPLSEVAPGLPESIRNIVEKMMDTDPNNRYADMRELGDALGEAAQELGIAVGITGVQPIAGQAASAPQQAEDVKKKHITKTVVRDSRGQEIPPGQAPITKTVVRDSLGQEIPPTGKEPHVGKEPHHVGKEPITKTVVREYPEMQQTKSGGSNVKVLIAAIIVVLLVGGAIAAKLLYFDKQEKEAPEIAQSIEQPKDEAATSTTSPGSSTAEAPVQGDNNVPADGSSVQAEGQTEGQTEGQAGNVANSPTPAAGEIPGQNPPEGTASGSPVESATPNPGTAASARGEVSATPAQPAGDSPGQSSQKTPPASSYATTPSSSQSASGTSSQGTSSQGTSSQGTSSQQASSRQGTATSGTAPIRRKPVQKAPAPNTVFIAVSGSGDNADIIADYVEEYFSNLGFDAMERGGAARYKVIVKVMASSGRESKAYGMTTQLQALHLGMKLKTQNGKQIARTSSRKVEFSDLNMEDNLRDEVKKQVRQLANQLKR